MQVDPQHLPPNISLLSLLRDQPTIATPLRNAEFCVSLLQALDPSSRFELGRTCRYLMVLAQPLISKAYDASELFSHWPRRAIDQARESTLNFRPGALRRELTASEWGDIDRRALRVQHVVQPVVVGGSFVLLERSLVKRINQDLPLFPKLLSVKLQHQSDTVTAAKISQMLLPPSLEALHLLPCATLQTRVQNESWTVFHAASQAFLSRLSALCIGNWATLPASLVRLSLGPLSANLRRLELRAAFPASDMANLLQNMALIEELTVLNTTGRATAQLAFSLPRLTKLSADTGLLVAVLRNTASLPNLLELTYAVSDYFGPGGHRCYTTIEELQQCVDLIGMKCTSVKHLWFCVPSPVRLSKKQAKLSLQSLSNCSAVIDFRINAEDKDYALSDAEVELLAPHWPKLKYFSVNQTDQRPRASLACLISLSQHCQELESFVSPIRYDGTPRRLAAFGSLPELRTVHLGQRWAGSEELRGQLQKIKNYLITGEV